MSRSFLEITNEFPGYDDFEDPPANTPLSSREKLPILRIIGICFSTIAFQIAYSTEFSLQVPIMKKLGLSEPFISIITITGPLFSFFVQPFVETISDNCRISYGRRRPFILFGGIGISVSFLIMYIIDSSERRGNLLMIILFSFSLLLLNFSIQVLQSPSKSIISDLVPQGQQAIANLISSLMLNITAILINLISGLIVLFSKDKYVLLFSALLIFICITITAISGKEEPLLIAKENISMKPITSIFSTLKSMTTPIFKNSFVYLLSWMGYYPFILELTDFCGNDVFMGRHEFNDHEYKNGVSFGMFLLSFINLLVLLYRPFQEKVVRKFGMRLVLLISQIIEGACLILVWFVSFFVRPNKYAILFFLAPIGISATVFVSIPFAIIELSVPSEHTRNYTGVLNLFGAIGQQASAFLVFALFGAFSSCKANIFAVSALFAFAAASLSKFIVMPICDSTVIEPLAPSSDYYND